MSAENALIPTEQRQVTFYDDELTAVFVEKNGEQTIYVPIRPLCNFLGIAWTAQRQRILRDPVLAEEMRPVIVTITGTGQEVETLCLPLDYLNGFLFGINATRVKEEIRERLIRYQRECYKVLSEAFKEGRLTSDPLFDELLQSDSESVQAYKMLQAMIKLARNQIMIEAKLDTHDLELSDHRQRLEQLETTLGDPSYYVTPEQAMQISQAVKAVAHELGKRSKRNEYGGVYGELYRRYKVNSYIHLPKSKFEDAMAWLNEWLNSLYDAESGIPF